MPPRPGRRGPAALPPGKRLPLRSDPVRFPTIVRDGEGNVGVFAYGPTSTVPASSYGASNYWVDVVFTTTPPAAP
jgi:hypothetical protein